MIVLILGSAAWVFVPALAANRTAGMRTECLANLGRIGQAVQSYLASSEQHWPYVSKLASLRVNDPPWPTLPEALSAFLAPADSAYRCPADRRELAPDSPLRNKFPASTTWHATEGTSYEWVMGSAYGGKKVGEETLAQARGFGMGRADQPLLQDFELFHAGDTGGDFNVLNADLKARTARARKPSK